MKPAFILLHGLPGAGKTTAARLIAEMSPGIFFIDWGAHPDFGKKPAQAILAKEYLAHADGRSVITEGVLEDRSNRDRLVSAVIAAATESRFPLQAGLIIFLDEQDTEMLASRRSGDAAFYAERRARVSEGSELFPWVHYKTDSSDRGDPALRAEHLLGVIDKYLEPTV